MPRTFALQQDQKHQASTTALLNTVWMETGGPCLLFTIGRVGKQNSRPPGSWLLLGNVALRPPFQTTPALNPSKTHLKTTTPPQEPAVMLDKDAALKLDALSSISNLIQPFTSTAKSQYKLILQRARLCKLRHSSNINSTTLAYNFSNLMFSWPRVNPSNWRWKQFQKAWPTAQHRLKKSQRGPCSQPRG